MRAHGLVATVSSIHVNGWFGDYDKLTTSRTMMSELFGVDIATERARYVFAGDSPNDASLFAQMPLSVGVANVRSALAKIPIAPAWLCSAECGAGFVEFASALLLARPARVLSGGRR